MYLNFKYLESKGLSPTDACYLIACAQNRAEDISQYMTNWFGEYNVSGGYTEQLKNGKYVLTPAGRKLYELIQIPDLTDNDIILYDWLAAEATTREWDLGSKKKVLGLISWFRAEANLTSPELYDLLERYLAADDSKYNKKLEYLFFKPVNAYSKRNLNDSRLYNWYQNNSE